MIINIDIKITFNLNFHNISENPSHLFLLTDRSHNYIENIAVKADYKQATIRVKAIMYVYY